jgi:hypothetical protein
MDPALAGLIGVGIGGALTFLTEERRGWFERRRERAREARDLQQAFRLVESEWLAALFAFEVTLEERAWWSESSHVVEARAWERFKPTLAASDLTEQAWDSLTLAASEIASIKRLRGEHPEKPVGRDYPQIVGAISAINDGINDIRARTGKNQLGRPVQPEWYDAALAKWTALLDEGRTTGERPPDDSYDVFDD